MGTVPIPRIGGGKRWSVTELKVSVMKSLLTKLNETKRQETKTDMVERKNEYRTISSDTYARVGFTDQQESTIKASNGRSQ